MKKILCLLFTFCFALSLSAKSGKKTTTGAEDRAYTVSMMQRLVDPVLKPLSKGKLVEEMPIRDWEAPRVSNIHTTYLQGFGRTLSGLGPWLSLGNDGTKEGKLREEYAELARKCLVNATDPNSPDYMFGKVTVEMVVHAAYIAYPLIVAKEQLWDPLSKEEKENVTKALLTSRKFPPYTNNWLLFTAITECAFWQLTDEEPNMDAIEFAINKHEDWYLGDGFYGDGPNFHWDFYNSYVIQPLYLETLKVCKEMGSPLAKNMAKVKARGARYALYQEHLISPEGTFPVVGRSSVYRIAAFQHLGYMLFRYGTPKGMTPGGTRAALTTVIKNMMDAPNTFAKDGFLNCGLVGQQENARDEYNYTGALYMCVMGLTHLGLPATDPFWSDPAEKWFQQRVWSGEDVGNQHFEYNLNKIVSP